MIKNNNNKQIKKDDNLASKLESKRILEEKKQLNHAKALKRLEDKLEKINNKLKSITVNSKKTLDTVIFLAKQKYHVQLEYLRKYYQQNVFKKRLKEFYKVKSYKKLGAAQLYSYIQYIENNKSLIWLNPVHIRNLCIEEKRLQELTAKFDYFKAVVSNEESKKLSDKDKRKLKFAIVSSKSYIKNLRPSVFSKYHAKVVLHLENIKKTEPTIAHNPENIITLRNVSKYYVNQYMAFKVLKNVDLEVPMGKFVVILGPSGSGKTTLLNIISGMDNATYGDVVIANESLINKRGSALTVFRKNNIGYVFQQYGLLPNLTVWENVEIGANLQKDKSKQIDITELLNSVGMLQFKKKFPYELSGGQQQRVSIARSLAKNPTLLFGDEPTGAIDEKNTKEILQLFSNVNKKYKTTIIVVTHNALIAEMADMVIKFNDGVISQIIHNDKPKTVAEINW